ncbi:hypothetical protein Ddye_005022 [Dipteronia dyeriana]|uniref:Uncharacterized protein n=1 Tax=Dipteronia dyeriana TaxID=168575 RepID=A0AAD9XFH8_9ROSI|nr:hypothetical protein Ddye_005022 [Dipteronia dyeriana]
MQMQYNNSKHTNTTTLAFCNLIKTIMMSSNNQRMRFPSSAIVLVVLMIMVSCSPDHHGVVVGAPLVPALFVFGDSLVDDGNNNFLSSIAKANYYPYGVDFDFGVPTGRFSNGKNFIDFIAKMMGVPYPPPFADPNAVGTKLLGGVNYASAAAGILDESGRHYGQRYSLSQQVLNFESTLNRLRTLMPPSNLTNYLAKSVAVLSIGSNDYINNYLMPSLYPSRSIYTPPQFANLLLNNYVQQLVALYSVGLRKFFVAGIGPLGCIPNQRASGQLPRGRCVNYVNQMLGTYNEGLKSVVNQLNKRPGFIVIDRGCCGVGRDLRQVTCLPFAIPCPNRNQYLFWDAFHPTEAANAILANRAFYGSPSDAYPFNIQTMILH